MKRTTLTTEEHMQLRRKLLDNQENAEAQAVLWHAKDMRKESPEMTWGEAVAKAERIARKKNPLGVVNG